MDKLLLKKRFWPTLSFASLYVSINLLFQLFIISKIGYMSSIIYSALFFAILPFSFILINSFGFEKSFLKWWGECSKPVHVSIFIIYTFGSYFIFFKMMIPLIKQQYYYEKTK